MTQNYAETQERLARLELAVLELQRQYAAMHAEIFDLLNQYDTGKENTLKSKIQEHAGEPSVPTKYPSVISSKEMEEFQRYDAEYKY
jgi:hypothetical protein